MAVLIHKLVPIEGVEVDLKVYQPGGRLSKGDRERADRLDKLLSSEIPTLDKKINDLISPDQGLVRRWYVLGQLLRQIIHKSRLVSNSDLSRGLLWQAVWYYLPASLKPAGAGDGDFYMKKGHKRKDHLSLCYEISAHDWNDVSWIQRWDDWHQLAFRPGLLRDPRILRALSKVMSAMDEYPTRETFRRIVKKLVETFPTRRLRDSSFLSDDAILCSVTEDVRSVSREQTPHA